MGNNFQIKFTQIEKTVSTSKLFISLGILKIKLYFETRSWSHVFVTFTILLFDSGVCLPFNQESELNLKRNQNSNRKKSKFQPGKIKTFPEKNN